MPENLDNKKERITEIKVHLALWQKKLEEHPHLKYDQISLNEEESKELKNILENIVSLEEELEKLTSSPD